MIDCYMSSLMLWISFCNQHLSGSDGALETQDSELCGPPLLPGGLLTCSFNRCPFLLFGGLKIWKYPAGTDGASELPWRLQWQVLQPRSCRRDHLLNKMVSSGPALEIACRMQE